MQSNLLPVSNESDHNPDRSLMAGLCSVQSEMAQIGRELHPKHVSMQAKPSASSDNFGRIRVGLGQVYSDYTSWLWNEFDSLDQRAFQIEWLPERPASEYVPRAGWHLLPSRRAPGPWDVSIQIN
jgi:hypothetical protein